MYPLINYLDLPILAKKKFCHKINVTVFLFFYCRNPLFRYPLQISIQSTFKYMGNYKICALGQRSPYTAIGASRLKNSARNGPAFVKTFSRSGKLSLLQAATIACSCTPAYIRQQFIIQWYSIDFFITHNDHHRSFLRNTGYGAGLFLSFYTFIYLIVSSND